MKLIYYITLLIFLFFTSLGKAQTLTCDDIILDGVISMPKTLVNDNDNNFGRDRTMLGDINGDGNNDMLVYSKTYSGGNGFAVFHVLFLDANGNVIGYKTNPENVFSFGFTGYEPDERVSSLTSLGYANGKHYIAVGAIGVFWANRRIGGIAVAYIDSDGSIHEVARYTYDNLVWMNNPSPVVYGVYYHHQPRMGSTIEAIGDIDNNGMPDFAVHAKIDGCHSPCYGKLIVVKLQDSVGIVTMKSAKDYLWYHEPSIYQPEMYAYEMATIGDIDGDSIPDIATGSPNRSTQEDLNTIGVTNRGAVYINFLNDDGSVRGFTRIEHGTLGMNLPANSLFGSGIAAIGDIDCNGVIDLVVSDAAFNLYVLLLNSDGTLKRYQKIDATTLSSYTIPSYPPTGVNSYGGLDVGEDRDGDGLKEILVKSNDGILRLNFSRACLGCACTTNPSEAVTLTFPAYQLNEVINTSAQTLSDNWLLSKYTPFKVFDSLDLPELNTRPYVVGKQGIWRGESSFAYVTDRKQSSTIDLKTDGTYTLNMFNWKYLGELDCPEWRKVETVSEYHPQSSDVERYNILKLYSSFHIGYSDQLVSAAAANSKQYEFGFEGFEEYTDDIYYANANLLFSTKEERRVIPIPYWFTLETGRNRRIWAPLELQTLQNQYAFTKLHVLGKQIDVNYPGEFRSHTTFEEITIENDKSLIKFSLNEATPFEGFWTGKVGVTINKTTAQTFNGGQPKLVDGIAHTGTKSLKIDIPASFNQPYLLLIPNKKYVVSAWVRIDNEDKPLRIASYQDLASLQVELGDRNRTTIKFKPEGQIIEGWQRIEGSFTVPSDGMGNWNIQLVNQKGLATYFDDIRLFPSLGNMESFVYDTETFRLEAKLDANNYATFYYYDAEGRLYLVKQETAKGVQTLQTVTTHTKRN